MAKFFGCGIEREVNPVTFVGDNTESVDFYGAGVNNIRNTENSNGDRAIVRGNKGVASYHHDVTVTGVEIQSGTSGGSDWKNKTLKKASTEIRYAEKKLLERLRRNNSTAKIFPFGTVGNKVSSSGHGSYHFSLTLPIDLNTNDTILEKKNKLRNHFEKNREFFRQIQWIEPLLIAKIGAPRINSINDGGHNTEGSERVSYNNYGGPISADFGNLLDIPEDGPNARMFGKSSYWRKNAKIEGMNKDTNATDIRNRRMKRLHSYESPGGFEIRFADTFDSQFVYDYSKVLALLSQNEADGGNFVASMNGDYNNSSTVQTTDDDAGKAMARVLEEGYNAYLPKEYVAKVNAELKLGMTADELKKVRAKDVADLVFHKIYENNKDNEDAKILIGESEITEPHIFDVNENAFDYFYRIKLRKEKDFRDNHEELIKGMLSLDYDGDKELIAGTGGVKTLLEQTLGESMSAEDTRDFIDFMEKHDFYIVKRDDSGKIVSIKLNYSNSEEAVQKFRSVYNDSTFYSGRAAEPILENYETDEQQLNVIFDGSIPEEVSRATVQTGTTRRDYSETYTARRESNTTPDSAVDIGSARHTRFVARYNDLVRKLDALSFRLTTMRNDSANVRFADSIVYWVSNVGVMRTRMSRIDPTTSTFSNLKRVYNQTNTDYRELKRRISSRTGQQLKNRNANKPVKVSGYKRRA